MRIVVGLFLLSVLFLSGCGNLSPKDNLSPQLKQQLEDINGSMNTLENNQNSIKIELGKLQQTLNVGGNDNQIQQGWLNVKADGIVIGIFAAATIGMLLFYMYKAEKYKKVATILGEQVRDFADPDIKEAIMAAAWATPVEKDIFKMIK